MMTGHETPKNFTWEGKNQQKTKKPESQQYESLNGVAMLKNAIANFLLK